MKHWPGGIIEQTDIHGVSKVSEWCYICVTIADKATKLSTWYKTTIFFEANINVFQP